MDYPIYPISVGMVREDGEEYYAEYANAPIYKANDFVKQHVIPNLKSYTKKLDFLVAIDAAALEGFKFRAKYPEDIKKEIIDFAGEKPEFWGYFADYDWVCLCQTMGRMVDLPNSWPMYCLDIKQLMHQSNIVKAEIEAVFPQPDTHNALDDAKWNKLAYARIQDLLFP